MEEVFEHFEEEGYKIYRNRNSFTLDWKYMPSKEPGLYESTIALIADAKLKGETSLIVNCILPKKVKQQLVADGFKVFAYFEQTRVDWKTPRYNGKTTIPAVLDFIRNMANKGSNNIL